MMTDDAWAKARPYTWPAIGAVRLDGPADPDPPPHQGNGRDEADKAELLPFIDPTTLEGREVPWRQWLVGDWIPWGVVTALYGDSKTGKSRLAMQLLASAATGRPWLSMPVMRCRALGLFCEDDAAELHRRQTDINAAVGCTFADLTDLRWLDRVGEDNLLMTFDADGRGRLTPLWHRLHRTALDFGAKLVTIDTAADTFGGNENIRGEVRQFIQAALGRLARDIDGSVVLTAHPSRAGLSSGTGDSGSTAWTASVRCQLYLRRPEGDKDAPPPEDDERELTRPKANYAAGDARLRLRWRNGVWVPETESGGGMVAAIERGNTDELFLTLLAELAGQGRNVSANCRSGNYAPKLFANSPNRRGNRQSDFAGAMERLFSAGKITVATYKKRNRQPAERIEIVAAHPPAPGAPG